MADSPEQFEDETQESSIMMLRWPWYWRLVGGVLALSILLFISFQVAYIGKIYPGVSANGVSLSGMSKAQAVDKLNEQIKDFSIHTLAISYGSTVLRVPLSDLEVKYDAQKAAELAYDYGRQGGWSRRFHEQVRAIASRPTNFAVYTYNDEKLAPYIAQVNDDVDTVAEDAALTFNDNKAQVTPAQAGKRLSTGRLIQAVEDRLSRTDVATIPAPTYELAPVIGTEVLASASDEADKYVSAPVTLSYNNTTVDIEQATIISWLKVNHRSAGEFLVTHDLNDLYPGDTVASFSLNKAAIAAYVAGIAKKTDQTPQNAGLAMQDNKLSIVQASRNGVTMDQAAAAADIEAALSKPDTDRTVALDLKVVKADVNEENLDSLGIKEQISEGQTFFPGSPSTRLTNVRAGASKFNGVLVKPGATFSFGAILGAVDASTGYVPELVILGDHEEKQYGGGLCQVSSTAFRAALLAGLPILERYNHAFAISYYTAPYGVPGVDATIYYPSVDFKFKNDTGSYILIQTIMQGTTLKFDFFGTKTKTGNIRGPQFVTGSSDATQPSHTVFYRDVLDLAGNVTKTDKFDTYYKSSKDFPVATSGYN